MSLCTRLWADGDFFESLDTSLACCSLHETICQHTDVAVPALCFCMCPADRTHACMNESGVSPLVSGECSQVCIGSRYDPGVEALRHMRLASVCSHLRSRSHEEACGRPRCRCTRARV